MHVSSVAIAEAAQLFVMLRGALNLSREKAAELLAIDPYIISALETGRISALPPWPDTERLVNTYLGMAGFNPGPVLAILKAEVEAQRRFAAAPAPVTGPFMDQVLAPVGPPGFGPVRAPVMAPAFHADPYADPYGPEDDTVSGPQPYQAYVPSGGITASPAAPASVPALLDRAEPEPAEPEPAGPRWRKGRGGRPVPVGPQHEARQSEMQTETKSRRTALNSGAFKRTLGKILRALIYSGPGVRLGLIGSGLAVAMILALSQPWLVQAVSRRLPDPMARGLRSVHDYVLVRFAPEREGMRWIEVSDPRARKSDKLHNVRQSD